MNIALIAHDKKKEDMIQFALAYKHPLDKHHLYATGTTGRKVAEHTGLPVQCVKSGPLGGDQQIGALIAENKMDLVLFFRDPLTAQPHEPDIIALLRLCDVYQIPLATNMATAEMMLRSMDMGNLEWRLIQRGDQS